MLNKNIKKILFWGMLIFSIILGYILIHSLYLRNLDVSLIEKMMKHNKVSMYELQELQIELDECQKYNIFQKVTSEIGKREYSKNYDCFDHSKDLQKALREVDIESSIFKNDGKDHFWIGVWIESTNGQFIKLNHKYKILETK